jgi:AP-1 complex subunit gamma-1
MHDIVPNISYSDMNNPNMYIVGLALCTLGNISSPEMARDLCGDLEKLLGSSNTYIRKKAALCALRIIKKVPDLMENFIARAKSLLNERNHGVLLTGITLLTEMCLQDPEILTDVRSVRSYRRFLSHFTVLDVIYLHLSCLSYSKFHFLFAT